jgi:hypothetical protein
MCARETIPRDAEERAGSANNRMFWGYCGYFPFLCGLESAKGVTLPSHHQQNHVICIYPFWMAA